ncbi:MAG: hypothetical protein AB1467_02500 [Candidatus Diapherotrites archaeon]
METKIKNLLLLSPAFIALLLISFSFSPILNLVYGIIRDLYGGISLGKTILIFLFFMVNPIISIAFIKSGLSRKIQRKDKIFLCVFILIAVIGFWAGLQMFNDFSVQFKSKGPFATILPNPVVNWEASRLTHNHFPKISIYYLENITGINLGNKFDDGKPWYELFPNADAWAAFFSAVLALLLIFGTLHLNSRAHKIKAFDYLLFLAAEIGFIIHIIDGGIASGLDTITAFFFLLYISRTAIKFKDKRIEFIFPLLSLSFLIYPAILFGFELEANVIATPVILSLGLLYYFFKSIKAGILEFKWFNALLFLLLLLSLYLTQINVINFGYGRSVSDLSKEQLPSSAAEGGGLYVYGLPREMTLQEFNSAIKNYGEIIESDKVGWVAYARIKPFRPFRTGELQDYFNKKFPSETYLYVEENIPLNQVNSFTIYWFEDVNSQKFLGNQFLGISVESIKDNLKDKTTDIIIKAKTDQTWQMLSILTEIREKGFNGKILLAKKS